MECSVFFLLIMIFNNAVQTQELWRTDDLECGWNHKLDNGKPTPCNPDGKYPCCSQHGWCGHTANHCGCAGCKDYRRDRCGSKAFTIYGEASSTCDPASSSPCCSDLGWCGSTDKHCKHMDYRYCFTKEYEPCVFPFKYRNKVYRSCTTEGGKGPWCATETKSDLTHVTYGYCQYNCKAEPPLIMGSVKTSSGYMTTWPVSDLKAVKAHWFKTLTSNTELQMQAKLSKTGKWQPYNTSEFFITSQHWHKVLFGNRDHSLTINNKLYKVNIPKQGLKVDEIRFTGKDALYWTSVDPVRDQWLQSLDKTCAEARSPRMIPPIKKSRESWSSLDWWLRSSKYPSLGLNIFLLLMITVTILYYKQNLKSIKIKQKLNTKTHSEYGMNSLRSTTTTATEGLSDLVHQGIKVKGGINNVLFREDSGICDTDLPGEYQEERMGESGYDVALGHENIAYEDDYLGNNPYVTEDYTNKAYEDDFDATCDNMLEEDEFDNNPFTAEETQAIVEYVRDETDTVLEKYDELEIEKNPFSSDTYALKEHYDENAMDKNPLT